MRTMLSISAIVAALASSTHATDRYYPDFSASSANGRFRLDANSPDNKDRDRPFASNFVYTFTDTETGVVLWTIREHDESPIRAWVHDDGWVVVRDARDRIEVFEPVSARTVVKTELLGTFMVSGEFKSYGGTSTAGAHWDQGSFSYFIENGDELVFVVRPWWGRRVYVGVDSGRIPPRDDAVLGELCDRFEAEWSLNVLGDLAKKAEAGVSIDRDDEQSILRATNIVSYQRLEAAVPDLLELEQWVDPIEADRFFTPEDSDELDSSDLGDDFALETRQRVQHAIRRAGHAPIGMPSVVFIQGQWSERRHLYAPRPTGVADEQLAMVVVGNCGHDAVELAGAPYLITPRRVWEYDVDDPPCTYRFNAFNDEFDQIERLNTPAWEGELGRLHELNLGW